MTSIPLLLVACFVVLASESACALDRERSIRHLYHAAWTVRDGAPGDIYSLAQSDDGELWMAGHQGLFHFDGLRFERYQPPAGQRLLANSIRGIIAGRDNQLWVTYEFGGASLIQYGRLTNFGGAEGLPTASVLDAQVDMDGNLWLATTRELLRFDGKKWARIGEGWNFPYDYTRVIHMDRKGTLWVAAHDVLLSLRRGTHEFRSTNVALGRDVTMADGPDGTLWLGTNGVIRHFSTNNVAPFQVEPIIHMDAATIRFDHDGALWIATRKEGTARIAYPERIAGTVYARDSQWVERYTELDGLSSDHLSHLLIDRQGDVWVASSHGLDRFRNEAVSELLLPAQEDLVAIASDPKGDLFIAGTRAYHILGDRIIAPSNADGPTGIVCAYRDPTGAIWLGGSGTLWKYANDRYVAISVPGGLTSQNSVQTMTTDRNGVLWVSFLRAGIFQLIGRAWSKPPHLPAGAAIAALTDPDGGVWLGYPGNRVAKFKGGVVQLFNEANGVSVGNVSALASVNGQIWLGGDYGLQFLSKGRFLPLRTTGSNLIESVSGIVSTSNGDLWTGQASGITRVRAFDVLESIRDPKHSVQAELFNFLDGIRGSPSSLNPLPSLVRGQNDRLWFITQSGLFWLDPARVRADTQPPPVLIQSLVADGISYAPSHGERLQSNLQNLEINYTALDLAMPERVHFRYKLDGVDRDWLDVGSRRQAFYTKLRPGYYRFRLMAVSGSGVANENGETIEFVIPPAFYQTSWFKLVCGIACLLAAGLIFQVSLHGRTRQVKARLSVRLEERERIARELHDTLLQGFQAVVLHLQVAIGRLPDDERVRKSMEAALNHADEMIAEGRDRVQDLRGEGSVVDDLAAALACYGDQLGQQDQTDFRVTTVGSPRELNLIVRDEFYRIGREALNNSFKHAHASTIEVEIVFENASLRMTVRDNGVGIDKTYLDGGRPGHWGLSGMRERAQKLGGQLSVWSRQGAGTEFDVRLPGPIAYRNADLNSGWSWTSKIRNLRRGAL